ncbi:cytochrome c [Reyranella aquatilis]|uniref:Cytochrome c n=1 Tax=Reyranella aquatilis TaxID=2035356 RepID=A0ABS8KWU5_9HYPH|nr:cytochrome c [Reyranella aquatilis]MCC8430564.1 cytochrome c [Reyranella aquatilis]
MGKRLFVTSRRGWRGLGVVAALLGIVFTASALVLLRERPVRIDPGDPNQVALGKRLYATACASCHGVSLEGQPDWQRRLPSGRLPAPPHDASGHTWHHPDDYLVRVTQLGPAAYPDGYQTDMPGFHDALTVGEIAAILAYIKSTWPADIRARQNRLNVTR